MEMEESPIRRDKRYSQGHRRGPGLGSTQTQTHTHTLYDHFSYCRFFFNLVPLNQSEVALSLPFLFFSFLITFFPLCFQVLKMSE